MTPQILEERLIDFAVTIVSVVESLPNSKAGKPNIIDGLFRTLEETLPRVIEA